MIDKDVRDHFKGFPIKRLSQYFNLDVGHTHQHNY